MSWRLAFIFLFLSINSLHVTAQYFVGGQDPASLKWSQINTENFQIIFPQGFESESQRLANSLEKVYLYARVTLKSNPKKISVILHNYSSVSNAFVAWAPKRVEFFTIPGQDIYPQDWLNQLAIHEYRHVVQISKLNQGFTKILSIILGEQGTAAVLGLFVPLWFLEGDAVVTETALSHTGRGRIPEFEMLLRTQVIGQKIFSYEKEYFGSYRDFVPDYYKMGYFLVASGRKNYGYQLWDKAVNNVGRNPYYPTPFSKGIKKSTSQNKWKFYKSTFIELDSLWQHQQSLLSYTTYQKRNSKKKKVYTNYHYPQYLNDSSIIALKEGLGNIQEFVKLDSEGKEHSVFIPGYFSPVWLSVAKNYITWPEYGFDKRWENRTYSDVYVYDIKNKLKKQLTKHRFIFSPALSPDGSQIVAVEVEEGNRYSLVFFESKTGKELRRIYSANNNFLLTPTWSDEGKFITYCFLTTKGKSIGLLNIETGNAETLLPYSYLDITQPVKHGNYIYFHGTYSGIDNIYCLEMLSGKVFQVTSAEYGAFDPCISSDGSKLLYSDYSPLGYNVVETDLLQKHWIPLDSVENKSIQLYNSLIKGEEGVISFDTSNHVSYGVRPYRKFSHLINVHSWAPAYINTSSYKLNPGVSILSQNKLSTFTAVVGYLYNYNESSGQFNASLNYLAWYPILGFSIVNELRRSAIIDSLGKHNYNWRENTISLSVSQPLNFTRGHYRRALIPTISFGLKDIYNTQNVPHGFYAGQIATYKSSFLASRLRKMSKRDMRSLWGQQLEIDYDAGLKSERKIKNLFAAELVLLFPGIRKYHSLKTTIAYQSQGAGVINFSSPIAPVRGFNRILNSTSFNKFSIDYKLPILYPDLKVGALLYLQRVKANLFWDYANSNYKGYTLIYESIGVELTNDLHLFNFFSPFDLGVRFNYFPRSQSSNMEFIFGIGL